METLGAATLAKSIPDEHAVATIVPREEIAAVLEDREGSPELLLRLVREGDEPTEIAMTWSRDELARLLEDETGPNVVLTFDRDELSRAIGDVEAHGLRERALVFAVAATGVLGTGATVGHAMPATDVGGAVVTAAAPAVSGAPAMTDASSAGGYGTAAATTGAADTMVSDAASGSGYVAPAPVPEAAAAALGVTDVSSGAGYGTVEATTSSPASVSISRSDAVTDGLIAGGVLLAIAGATFASRRTGTARPA